MIRAMFGGLLVSTAMMLACPRAASADFYFGRATGELVISSETPPMTMGMFNEFVFVQEGLFNFDTVVVSFTITDQDPDPDRFDATCVFTDSVGDTLSGVIAGVRFISTEGFWSGSGDWDVTGGTGAYAAISGGGSFAFAASPADQLASSTFEGEFVPAPGTGVIALAGAGALAAVRRRRS